MVVDEEREVDARHERVQRLGLRLGVGAGPAVGVAERERLGALVVVAPLVGEVAVEVDAVVGVDHAVAVVVAQVLAPEPLVLLEGPVVAVGIGDGKEPQLRRVHDAAQLRVAGRVAVEVVVGEPPHHLRRDPLACVLRAEIEHGGALAVRHLVGVLGDLQGDDVLALMGLADGHELGDPRVRRGHLLELLLQPAGARVVPEDLEPVGRERGRALRRRHAVDALGAHLHALAAQLVSLATAQDRLDAHGALAAQGLELQLVAIEPELAELAELGPVEFPCVDVEPRVSAVLRRRRRLRDPGGRHRQDGRERDRSESPHVSPSNGRTCPSGRVCSAPGRCQAPVVRPATRPGCGRRRRPCRVRRFPRLSTTTSNSRLAARRVRRFQFTNVTTGRGGRGGTGAAPGRLEPAAVQTPRTSNSALAARRVRRFPRLSMTTSNSAVRGVGYRLGPAGRTPPPPVRRRLPAGSVRRGGPRRRRCGVAYRLGPAGRPAAAGAASSSASSASTRAAISSRVRRTSSSGRPFGSGSSHST